MTQAPSADARRLPHRRRRSSMRCVGDGRARMQARREEFGMATFVLVHGAWRGGWAYNRVAERLRARGHRVFAPTLTGLGERSHLLSHAVNLTTHVDDVLNLI